MNIFCAYKNGDNSLREPNSHVVPGAHYISSLPRNLVFLRNTCFVIFSEPKDTYVCKWNNKKINIVHYNQVKPEKVPYRKVVKRASFRLLKKKGDVVEKLFFHSHASRVSLRNFIILQAKIC